MGVSHTLHSSRTALPRHFSSIYTLVRNSPASVIQKLDQGFHPGPGSPGKFPLEALLLHYYCNRYSWPSLLRLVLVPQGQGYPKGWRGIHKTQTLTKTRIHDAEKEPKQGYHDYRPGNF